MQVSITKALAELKKLENRLASAGTCFQADGKVVKVREKDLKDQIESNIKAAMQSFEDLLKRKLAIKTAVAKANILTEVSFPKTEAKTIYELIVEKEILIRRKDSMYAAALKLKDLDKVRVKENEKLDQAIQSIIEKAYAGTKPSESFVNDITASHYATQEAVIAFPITMEEAQAKMLELQDLVTEIDIYLSEINSKTMIEIPE